MGPLLPPFLSFAAGIALGDYLGLGYGIVVVALAASAGLVLMAHFLKFRFSSLALVPLFLSLGALFIIPYSKPDIPPHHILNKVKDDPISERAGTVVEGTVDFVESTGRRTKVWLDVEGVQEKEGFTPATGKALFSVNGRVELLPGDRVRALAMLGEPYTFGNPGEFDYRKWLSRRGVLVTGYVKGERLVERLEAGSGPAAFVQKMRTEIAGFIDSSGAAYPEPLKALVVSGQGGIDKGLREAFASTGTAHILSISGLHVGIVAGFSFWLFMFFFRRSERALLYLNAKKFALILSAVPAIIYAVLAGLPVPTQRSLVMVLAFIASFSIGRGKDHLNTLSLAGLIILAVFPGSVWDISFQLSFAAMASIIILVPRLKSLFKLDEKKEKDEDAGRKAALLKFLKRRIMPLILVTIAAAAGTSPILAWHFHRISLAGLAANMVAVPIAGVIVPVLLAASSLIPVSQALAWAVLFPADLAFALMAAAIEFFAAMPYASLWVLPPKPHEIVLYYLLMFFLANIGHARFFKYSAAVLAALLLVPWGELPFKENAPLVLRVTYLSVGQGESALLELPDGKTMLVDGGGTNNPDFDTGERVVAPYLRTKGIKRIDYMVLSHAQQDHMGGLAHIARNFAIGEFWWNGEGGLGRLGTELEKKNVLKRVVNASAPRVRAGGTAIDFLNPAASLLPDENDNSLVFKVAYGDRSFLFTGDISSRAERLLLGRELEADVLKAPHHGSKYSSSAEFLSAVSPSTIVISAGRKNSFGFPHEETLSRFREIGAEVMRTDTMGAVTIETDGLNLKKKAYLTDGEP